MFNNIFKHNKNKKILSLLFQSILLIILTFLLARGTHNVLHPQNIEKLDYNTFISMVDNKEISTVSINLTDSTFRTKDNDGDVYLVNNPKSVDFKKYLLENSIDVKETDSSFSKTMLNLFEYLLFLSIMVYIMKSSYRGKSFGSEKLKDVKTIKNITLDSVAGCEESKEELKTIITFLKDPKKYTSAGATLPKGAIMYGPPGTGKTLLAKAVACEANLSFFSISASDLVEKFVGVGASRVRDLFKKARENAPSIVFIDELDAIGISRGKESNSEKEQTIDALLTELDGINTDKSIFVLAATNRFNELDSALIRAGRFDKQIAVPLPDKKDRVKLFNLYLKEKKVSDDVNILDLANITYGLSGADIYTIVNEAIILAISNGSNIITKKYLDESFYKLTMKGHKKKNGHENEMTKKIVAYHEGGHALAAKLLTNDEVPSVSIIPSTSGAGGVTFVIPEKIELPSRIDLIHKVQIKYAGRVAESLLLGNDDLVTVGAQNDIEEATNIIINMIKTYGMEKSFGLLNLDKFTTQNDSILAVAKNISKKLYDDTYLLLNNNLNLLDEIANLLIEYENINETQLDNIINK